ncbi:bifunctional 3,4-dihydroxy-2-butanone-4-phosphate synthase/GTP cyclohydrolase II [Candidatus Protochlamydia phocaeensis]|uniref:bifunctional 3,4-dihydroxy-2-butanone-4-phosphate synthase/GTP cyclohydrolase II n=1 Tax=Candidatus Protochlamydia phocaeensis TaxID=1414722 RepID=UPI0008393E28|nr:bifunctional 3,4-dihydroxy-2-butanone-4-phosphate synthase/GTP cyclohydrolase II [Candidatus Protochlamydia phocaeensis]
MSIQRIEEALKALAKGKFVIVADDENRENEGDLILPAEMVTPEALAFMIRYTTGIVCLAMTGSRLDELRLPQMVAENTDRKQTAFTVSVDYRYDISTGVSAADRTKTILSLIDPSTKPEDLCRPGHIFPLRYREGGVLKRAGHTEAAVDLAQLANLYPAGVIAELINDDGTMMRMPDLEKFAAQHDIPLITVADIVRYRRKREKLVDCISQARLPTTYGEFTAYVYESKLDGIQHIALVKGDIRNQPNVLVRVHSECLTGDVFGSKRCDCGSQLQHAMQKITQEGLGAIIYLRGHEGRGIGLGHKLRAYQLQDQGRDTVEANIELGFPIDSREYGIGAQILADLGLTTIRLMTNNPSKYKGIAGYDLEIVERVPLHTSLTEENKRYLLAKKNKLGHLLEFADCGMSL